MEFLHRLARTLSSAHCRRVFNSRIPAAHWTSAFASCQGLDTEATTLKAWRGGGWVWVGGDYHLNVDLNQQPSSYSRPKPFPLASQKRLFVQSLLQFREQETSQRNTGRQIRLEEEGMGRYIALKTKPNDTTRHEAKPVSYTHLTLPTKLSV